MSHFISKFSTSDNNRRGAELTSTETYDLETLRLFFNSLDPNQLRAVINLLAPDQMSLLILSGVLDDKSAGQEKGESNFAESYPSDTEREGFDFEKWRNRPGLKIR